MAWGMVSHSFHEPAGIPRACSGPAGKLLLERRQVNLDWYLPVAGCQGMIPLCLEQSLGDWPLPVFSITSLWMLHAAPPPSQAAVVVVSHC